MPCVVYAIAVSYTCDMFAGPNGGDAVVLSDPIGKLLNRSATIV